MTLLGEWFDRLPNAWKALSALFVAASVGASCMAFIFWRMELPQQVRANTTAIVSNTAAIAGNTQAITDLKDGDQAWRDTLTVRMNGIDNLVILSICEQRELHGTSREPLTTCMRDVRLNLESMRVGP